jgi:stage III sporulation protein AA
MLMLQEEVLSMFPEPMRNRFQKVAAQADRLQEIRLRVLAPAAVLIHNREWFVTRSGELVDMPPLHDGIRPEEIEQVLKHLCQYSVYAFADEIRQGFLTIQGGHRIGLAGQVILEDNSRIRNIKYIRYLNIRIAHEIKGAADPIIPSLYENGQVKNTLLISPPGCGKTTMLRDIIRQISDGTAYGNGVSVSVVDERSEIAGSFLGVAQNDVGIRTDVLDGCPKAEGMMMLIRAMAPQVLAVDELGDDRDVRALFAASGCGCRLIATIHGDSLEDVGNKKYMCRVMENGLFERYVVLGKVQNRCVVIGIYDREGQICLK